MSGYGFIQNLLHGLIATARKSLISGADAYLATHRSTKRFRSAIDLLQIAIREGIAQVPPNAQKDGSVFEMPPAEQCRPF